MTRTIHVILPGDIDDPATPTGGDRYDREVCTGLAATGWTVREHPVPGTWPVADGAARARLSGVLGNLPGGALVLLDGLVASGVPEVLLPHATRLRLVALVHLPLGGTEPGERAALSAVAGIVTTSEWARRRLRELYALPHDIHVAEPGVHPAPGTEPTPGGTRLLCVAAVAPHKGHDTLIRALARTPGDWRCVCVGPLDQDPAFVAALRGRADGRVSFVGARTGAALEASYGAADLLVLASRGETYGMVVTEALARGIPVLVTDTGGVAEALGRAPDGSRPGMLVPVDDPAALTGALSAWLVDPALRDRLRASAAARRTTLSGWGVTTARVAAALDAVRSGTVRRSRRSGVM